MPPPTFMAGPMNDPDFFLARARELRQNQTPAE
jgi:hypothetical protein